MLNAVRAQKAFIAVVSFTLFVALIFPLRDYVAHFTQEQGYHLFYPTDVFPRKVGLYKLRRHLDRCAAKALHN